MADVKRWFNDDQLVDIARLLMKLHEEDEPREVQMVDHKDLVFDLIEMVEGATANGVAFNKLAMETRTELPEFEYRHYNTVDELLEEIGGMNEGDTQAYTSVILAAHNPAALVTGLKELLRRVLI